MIQARESLKHTPFAFKFLAGNCFPSFPPCSALERTESGETVRSHRLRLSNSQGGTNDKEERQDDTADRKEFQISNRSVTRANRGVDPENQFASRKEGRLFGFAASQPSFLFPTHGEIHFLIAIILFLIFAAGVFGSKTRPRPVSPVSATPVCACAGSVSSPLESKQEKRVTVKGTGPFHFFRGRR